MKIEILASEFQQLMKNNIKIELVTPVHNRRQITLQCLKSLSRIKTENLDVHIIMIDDGSTDGTTESIKNEFPNVEVIQGSGSLWFTEGTNVGIRAALKHFPDYILTFNDDSVFDSEFLTYLVETAEKNARSIVGSLLLLWDTPHKVFQVAPVFQILSGGWRHWHQQTVWSVPQKTFEVDLIVGNCVLFPAEVFNEHGLLNSKRYPHFGDAEFTPRLKKKGWKLLIDPRSRVFCQPNNLPKKILSMTLRQKFDALFFNVGHIHNLRKRLYVNLDGAPNHLKGFAAYLVFFVRVLFKRNVETAEWANTQKEKPLSEIFRRTIIND